MSEAVKFPECFDFVTKKVKPYRDTLTKQIHESDYWKFWDKRTDSYRKISEFDQVLVAARASKYVQLAFVENGQIFSDQLVVFITRSYGVFAALQSNVHSAWAWQCCTKMGQSTLRYAPSKAVATFPAPNNIHEMEDIGEDYHKYRKEYSQSENISLTQIYNNLHDRSAVTDRLNNLREKQIIVDKLTMKGFGWEDIELGHGFHKVPYLPENDRVRFTISEPARIEILRRLAELNRQRYQEEVNQNLHGVASRTGKARAGRSRGTSASEPTLDLGDNLKMTIEEGA